MSRPRFMWYVYCKYVDFNFTNQQQQLLTSPSAELERRVDAGRLSYRRVYVEDIAVGVSGRNQLKLFVQGQEVTEFPKVAYVRLPGAGSENFSPNLLTIVRHLEAMGIRCVNSSKAMELGCDKFRQLQLLSPHEIPFPATATFPGAGLPGASMVSLLGSPHGVHFPAILKRNNGSQGSSVMLLPKNELVEDITPNLHKGMYLLQEYIEASHGTHYRVLVVGDKVSSVHKMTNRQNLRVQSNIHRGGSYEKVETDATLVHLALKVTKILGYDFAGLDFLRGENGEWIFLEANANPGTARYEGAVSDIVDYLETLS